MDLLGCVMDKKYKEFAVITPSVDATQGRNCRVQHFTTLTEICRNQPRKVQRYMRLAASAQFGLKQAEIHLGVGFKEQQGTKESPPEKRCKSSSPSNNGINRRSDGVKVASKYQK